MIWAHRKCQRLKGHTSSNGSAELGQQKKVQRIDLDIHPFQKDTSTFQCPFNPETLFRFSEQC